MATTPRFNVDLTGTSVNNRVVDEPHTLPAKVYRSIAPIYGPYYTESLVVVDAAGSQTLTRDVHYKCLDVVGIPTAQSGKEICTIIVITAQSVSSNVILHYQALGGNYERTHEAIKLLMDNLLTDTRPVSWPNILNRPDGVEPSHHLHNVGDVYGFEYLTTELERLKNAILLGDEIAHMEILGYVDANISALRAIIEGTEALMVSMGITAATDANSSAVAAMQATMQSMQDIQSAILNVQSASDTLADIVTNQASAEASAIALIAAHS